MKEHIRQGLLAKRRNLSKYGVDSDSKWTIKNNYELRCDELCLHGICDAVISTPKETFILEFKNSENVTNNIGAKIQLSAYSMIYESCFDKIINRGFIIYGSKAKTFEVHLNDELRNKVLETRNSILDCIRKGTMPITSASENKCSQCEFFNFCSDRF